MKKLLSIFFSFLFAFHAHAGFVLERIDGTIWDQVERLRVPNNQITKLGDKRYLFETGSDNTIKDPGVEGINLQWVKYADAALPVPVDGTGGTTSNLTCESTTSTPLAGNKSLLISKVSGVSAQGSGCSIDFTINRADRANMIKVEFDYEVASGTFVAGTQTSDSDVVVYIYDVTNNKIVNFSGAPGRLYSFVDRFRGYFQASPDSVNYRLILHTATGSTSAWSVKFDSFSTSRSAITVGTIITDWESFTPIITTGSGSATNYTAFGMMRQVGDTYEVMSSMKFSAASASFVELYMRVPKNGAIDFNKMPLVGGDILGNTIGTGHSYDSGVTLYPGIIQPRAANIVEIRTAVQLTHTGTAAVSAQPISNTFPFTYNANDTITMRYSVPIVGLSAGARMSDGYDGVNQSVSLAGTATGTIATTFAASTSIIFPSIILNKTGLYNSTTGETTIKSSGDYSFNGNIGVTLGTTASTNYVDIAMYVNGAARRTVPNSFTISAGTFNASFPFEFKESLNAGDIVTFRVQSGFATKTPYISLLSVTKDSGTPFMSPTARVIVRAENSSSQVIANNTVTTLSNWTKVTDTNESFNAATGEFTSPMNACYLITESVVFNGAATTVGAPYEIRFGSTRVGLSYSETTASVFRYVFGSRVFCLNSGDKRSVVVYQNSGSSLTVNGAGSYTVFEVTKISD